MTSGRILIGICAGLASALLYLSILAGSTLGILLLWLSPLPILIAGMGWSAGSSLLAAGLATSAIAASVNVHFAAMFFLCFAGPAAWLGYLAMLGRPATESPSEEVQRSGGMEWYPVGRIVVWTAGLAAVSAAGSFFIAGDGITSGLAELRRAFGTVLSAEQMRLAGISPAQRDAMIAAMSYIAALGMAAMLMLMMSLNLWIAALVVARSKRSARLGLISAP